MATVAIARPAAIERARLTLHPGVLGAFIVLAGALHQLRPALDPDIGWHLRAGQLILSTHTIPRTDGFSHTFAGAPWIDFEWLWEAGLAALYAAGGRLAPVIAVSLLTGAIYGLVYAILRLRQLPPIMAAFGVAFSIQTLASYADVRPGMTGALLTAIFLLLLELARARSNRRWLLLLLPAEILWANTHGSFVLGPAICGLYGLAAAWEHLSERKPWRDLARPALGWAGLCVGLSTATLVNPLGLGLLRFTFASASLSTNRDFNGEWAAPNFHDAWTIPLLITVLASLLLPLLSRRVHLPKVQTLLLISATALVLRNSQFLTFYSVAAAPVLATMLWQLLNRPLTFRLAMPIGMLFSVVLALIGAASVQSIRPDSYDAELAKRYPAGAVSYIEQQHLQGPMWNEFNWGCYLISAMPGVPVFIDGRTEMYGDDFFKQYFDVATGAKSPDELFTRYGINFALLPKDLALATVLRTEGWTEPYSDNLASVFLRPAA